MTVSFDFVNIFPLVDLLTFHIETNCILRIFRYSHRKKIEIFKSKNLWDTEKSNSFLPFAFTIILKSAFFNISFFRKYISYHAIESNTFFCTELLYEWIFTKYESIPNKNKKMFKSAKKEKLFPRKLRDLMLLNMKFLSHKTLFNEQKLLNCYRWYHNIYITD